MVFIKRIVIVTIFVINAFILWGQNGESSAFTSLFSEETVLDVSMLFDITSLTKNKNEDYQAGKMVVYYSDLDSIILDVRIRARGDFRKAHCDFPPLMLNFKPDTLFTTDGYLTKVKLVTRCKKSKIYTNYLYYEYLIYKFYELLSPYSLRTRLLHINYRDTGAKERHYTAYGFLIEPMQMMTKRTGVVEVKGKYFKKEEIHELDADRVAIFNYMIANTDWRIRGGHNIKFIKRYGHRREQVTPVPYDFDFAGLVNASYATPAEWSDADYITDRDYCGCCRDSMDNYYVLLDEFLAIENDIYKTVMEFELLDVKIRKRLYKYISGFYKEIRKPKAFIRSINNSCMDHY